jgi:HlyD family secretion protein
MKRVLLIGGVLAGLVAAAWMSGLSASNWPWDTRGNGPAYRLAKVERGPIVASVSATGTINPVTTVIVGSQLSGQVVELLADFNDRVSAGQVVARLNADQIRARLDAARAELEGARASQLVQTAQIDRTRADIVRARAAIDDAQANQVRAQALLAEAERTLARQLDLRSRGVTTDAGVDAARTQVAALGAQRDQAAAQVASAQAQIPALEADIRVAQAQLATTAAQVMQREAAARQIEVDLRNTEIRSPVDGVVVQRNVELGQTVAASLQAPVLFLIAQDLRRMEIAANVDEADIGRVREGQRVSFTVNAYPGRSFEGSVRQVRLGAQTVQNVVIYTAIVSVENPRGELMPGMTANLRVETDRRDDVLKVPNAALRWRPAGTTAAPAAPQAGGGARLLNDFATAVKTELGLTQDQASQVDAIVTESGRAFAGLREPGLDEAQRRERAGAIRREMAARIRAVLNASQQTAFDALVQRQQAQREGRGTNLPGRVFTPGADGQPVAAALRLGVSDGTVTEVVSGDLAADQDVIIGGGPRPPAAAPPAPPPRFGF